MADKTVIIKLDVQEAGAEAQIVRLNTQLGKLTKGEKDYELVIKKIAIQEERLIRIQEKRASVQGSVLGATQKTTKVLNKQSDATGSATAATMELSRVVSDAPYGIRGMANNITQLVSQLGSASTKAGGLTAALRLMWKSLMGPLGVVFAITAVVSAIDYFYGANKKAEKSSDDTTDALSNQRKELVKLVEGYEDYIKVKESAFMTVAKEREMLKALVKESYLASNSDERRAQALTKLNKLYPKYFKNIKEGDLKGILEAEKRVNRVLENKVKLKKALTDAEIISNNIQLERIVIEQKRLTGNLDLIKDFEKIDRLKEEQKQVRELVGIYAALDLETGKEGKDDKGASKKKARVEVGFSIKTIQEQTEEADKFVKELAKRLGVKFGKEAIVIDPNIKLELSDELKQKIKEYNAKITAEIVLNSQLDDAEAFLGTSKKVLSGMTDFMNAQFDREMTIESNKTSALNQELNNRLLNEKLSKDERAKIQNQIAVNDEKLRLKQEKIERKKFNMNKVANIANALMDTSAAAIGVMKDAKGGFLSRLSQALPTIAFGLAQVAAISRQKFQSSSAKTPLNVGGASGNGGGNSEPSFNIVGRSRDNLLLNAIQSQFDQPLRAYVVARDVTNQQQLDGVITSASSI